MEGCQIKAWLPHTIVSYNGQFAPVGKSRPNGFCTEHQCAQRAFLVARNAPGIENRHACANGPGRSRKDLPIDEGSLSQKPSPSIVCPNIIHRFRGRFAQPRNPPPNGIGQTARANTFGVQRLGRPRHSAPEHQRHIDGGTGTSRLARSYLFHRLLQCLVPSADHSGSCPWCGRRGSQCLCTDRSSMRRDHAIPVHACPGD